MELHNLGWKYYNHSLLPTCEPHEVPNVKPVLEGDIWNIKSEGLPLFARWTSEWDCKSETSFWYVIKDSPFDIGMLKAKRRYEINKGIRNFNVSIISAEDFVEDLYNVTIKAYEGWPQKYRPSISKTVFLKNIKKWNNNIVYGCFDKNTGILCGYACLVKYDKCIEFNVLRTIPLYEKKGINAAIVYTILEDNNDLLSSGMYINDGARAVRHETEFQNYLIKYFGFRKAYCKLNIKYRGLFGAAVKILYPFRYFFNFNNRFCSNLCAIMKMEEFTRN